MTVAVTGATGFIGRYVVMELERHSVSPVLICRPGTEVPPALAKHQIIRQDIADPASKDAFTIAGRPDALIHLAWDGLPNYESLHHFEEELPTQYRFLSNWIRGGLKNLVVTGTCFEYGMQSGPLAETLPTTPRNPYGFAKDILRRQLTFLQQKETCKITWGRLFYLYGDGQSENSLFPQLRKAIDHNERIFNMSGGEQLRDYLPVTEAVSYLVRLALADRNYGVVNICSGQPVSVRRLVEGWLKQHGWAIELNPGYYPYTHYEPMAFWGDRRRLEECLNSTR
jgi:dTDP-6-deoxy-L-talose 4-dehydrogenase (NAD+)